MTALVLALVVGTWNGCWFPSGRAEHRAHPDVEQATCVAAAKMLAAGLAKVDPMGTNDVVLCLNEIRGPRAASNLVARIGRDGLRVVAVTGYRRRDRFDQQQDVIATTLPVVASGWKKWAPHARETPPRGYAFATLAFSPASTGEVFAVHLKSNYGATKPELADLNRAKRTHAVRELLARAEAGRGACIVAGDFNADAWRRAFAREEIFALFASAGFANVLERLPPDRRGTHPHRRYGDSALDYVMLRGLTAAGMPQIEPNEGLSDHFALFALVSAPQ